MSNAVDDLWVAGVDGCTGGWVAVFVNLNRLELSRTRFVTSFADIVNAEEKPVVIAVDMPIGLPDRIQGAGRVAEQAVRPWLRARGSCVFSIPSRSAVYAEEVATVDEAKEIARRSSWPPKAFSVQARGIFRKVREIDGLLREQTCLQERVFEVHPEVAFWKLNSECVLLNSKKTLAGREERMLVLKRAGVSEQLLTQRPPGAAKPDDLLDAIVSAVIAERKLNGSAKPFPDPPGRDSFGLPIAIWA